MQRSLLPLLKGLRIAEKVEPQLNGLLLGVPTEELLDEGQWTEHGKAAGSMEADGRERG